MLRFLTAGESHGPCLTAIVDGLPAGLPLSAAHVDEQLARRQRGYGRGKRMKIERDVVRLTSGVRGGLTLGSPLTLVIENRDWQNWQYVLDPGPAADTASGAISCPRPGHADLPGAIKYRQGDLRNVWERSSARETAARVAAGSVARRLLAELDVTVVGSVVQIGTVRSQPPRQPLSAAQLQAAASESPVSCPDAQASRFMVQAIEQAATAGDSLGGVLEIAVFGLPPGLGSYVQRDQTLDGRLAGALMSIQAIKGVEVGLGFAAAQMPGSRVHDEIFFAAQRGIYRRTNHAGGIEGGMSNGEVLLLRAAMKPIPTLQKPLGSIDLKTKATRPACVERTDTCAVPAACVVAEAVTAWELAVVILEKFGGDTLEEIVNRVGEYRVYARECDCFSGPKGEI